jgi:hypothetical protein
MIRYALFEQAKIEVRKYEKQNSLLIINSDREYFGSIDLVSFVKSLISYADRIGKSGVTILVEMDSFFHFDKLDHLIEYETSLPRRSDASAKRFCLYNEDDFDLQLSRKSY